jgi:hypothetical protein
MGVKLGALALGAKQKFGGYILLCATAQFEQLNKTIPEKKETTRMTKT